MVIKDQLGDGLSFDKTSVIVKKNDSKVNITPVYSTDEKTAIFNLGDMAIFLGGILTVLGEIRETF